MGNTRQKSKGRRDFSGGFAGIPRIVMDHQDFHTLSGGAVKLLMDLAYQYKGNNNGDLTRSYTVLKKRGFNSKSTIKRCIEELLDARLVTETRAGKFLNPGGVCALYALTWKPIDECKGKLDVKPTIQPPRKFSIERIKKPCPETGPASVQKPGRQQDRNNKGEYLSVQKLGRLRAVT